MGIIFFDKYELFVKAALASNDCKLPASLVRDKEELKRELQRELKRDESLRKSSREFKKDFERELNPFMKVRNS